MADTLSHSVNDAFDPEVDAMVKSRARKVVYFPEGPGFIFIQKLAVTNSSRVMVVKSVKDGALYVRKETNPEYFFQGQPVHSKEVSTMLSLGNTKSVPKLLGWVDYQDETYSKRAFNAIYTQLINAKTLQELRASLKLREKALTRACMWSIYTQMFAVYVQSIKMGALHVDGHCGNWFIHIDADTTPHIMLGDWGSCERAPGHDQRCQLPYCDPDCNMRIWWAYCSNNLVLWVVQIVESLIRFGNLSQLLNTIGDMSLEGYKSGETWLTDVERISSWYIQTEEHERSARVQKTKINVAHNHSRLQSIYDPTIPQYDDAVFEIWQMNSADPYDLWPTFWRTAYFDETSHQIVGLKGVHERKDYHDHTDYSRLPLEWLNDHVGTKVNMAPLDFKLEHCGDQGESEEELDMYQTGFEGFKQD